MEDLAYIIERCFRNIQQGKPLLMSNPLSEETWCMEIPVTSSIFEIPIFALNAFSRASPIDDNPIDIVVATIKASPRRSQYKTLTPAVKSIINTNYDVADLIMLPKKDEEPTYYGTYGVLFDAQFTPVVMMTWEVLKVFNSESKKTKFRFIRPILRVAPYIVTNKDDSVQRFIVNKIIPAALYYKTHLPMVIENGNFEAHSYTTGSFPVKVVIDNSPFHMRKISTPSISTTDKELLQVALDNIDELIQ